MKIYLASGFHRRHTLRKMAARLKERGHEVVSSWIWIDERPGRGTPLFENWALRIAEQNVAELQQADAIIVDGWGISETNHGGVHTELGFALGTGQALFLVGPRGNTFHWHPRIVHFQDWEFLLSQNYFC